MHVSQPIRSIVPTVDAPVLLVLAGTTRPLSGRRIAALAGASHAAVNAVLARLSQAGVVTADRHGNATLYVGNREHLAWPAIEVLTNLRLATLELLRGTVNAWTLPALCAFTFGSFARRDGDKDSDIDIAVIRDPAAFAATGLESEELWAAQLSELRRRVQAGTGNAIQLLDLDTARLSQHVQVRDPILDNWRRDGIHLAGVEFSAALAQAQDLAGAR
jgi:predicted nucleotidyltransferase